jgi:PmbA protein
MKKPKDVWNRLGDTARKTLKSLEKLGAEKVEAFFTTTQTTEVTIRNSEIHAENAAEDTGIAFRAATSDSRIGFACTNVVNTEESILKTGKTALSITKLSAPSPKFDLPTEHRIPNVSGLFDRTVLEVTVEERTDVARRMIESAESLAKGITAKAGQVTTSHVQKGIINTLGVDCETRETRVVAGIYGTGRKNGQTTPGCFDVELKRSFDLSPEKIGKAVAQKVIAQFDPKPVETFDGTLILEPEAVSYQFCDAMIDALNAKNIIAGTSPWKGRTGQTVASERLTVLDDGILEGGFGSRSFDDEGYPSQTTTLISKGTLRSFLHDATSSHKMRTQNTGNSSRSTGSLELTTQIVGSGYKAQPQIYPSNLTIQPGNKTKDQILSEVKKGILAEAMAGFVQPSSGLISAQLVRAHYIENGETKHPIRGGMVSGTAFDWLKQISQVGNERKQFPNSVVPSLQIEKVKIIGSR